MTNKNQYAKSWISRYGVISITLIGLITPFILSYGCTKASDTTPPGTKQPAPATAANPKGSYSLSISGDLPSDARYRLPYQERPDSPIARIKYPIEAIVLVDKAPIFNYAGKRSGELNAGQTIEVRGIFDTLILNDKTGAMNYYYRFDDNKFVSSRDILLRTFSEPSAGSLAAKFQIISNPVGYIEEDASLQYDLWLKTGGSYKYLGDSRIGNSASSVSSSSSYFFIKQDGNGAIKVYSSTGDQLWDAGTASPALYSPVWVGDALFLRGRAEYDSVYSLNPATKELKEFLDIPDGKGISDVRDETTEEAGEETSLFVCGEPIREENGLLKIIFKRVSDKPITVGKPIMVIDVTADKSGEIVKKQITGWISFEELRTSLRSRR